MMIPETSSRRTRSRQARAERPAVADNFWIDSRPSRCSAASILTSIRSSAGERVATMATLLMRRAPPCPPSTLERLATLKTWMAGTSPATTMWRVIDNFCRLAERLVLHGDRIVQPEPPAVGVDGLAGDVARIVRGEEDRDRGDLVGLTDAAERRAREQPALGLLVGRDRLEDIGHDRAWADRVDPDAIGRKRQGHHFGELREAALRHAIGHLVGNREHGVDRAHVDDHARRLAGLDLLDHLPRRGLPGKERA